MKVWVTLGCIDYSASYFLGAHSSEEKARAFAEDTSPRRFDQVEIYECTLDDPSEPQMIRRTFPGSRT